VTIFYPDISSYEDGMHIQPGTVAVVAKATEGIGYSDANYEDFKAQAAAVGAIFSGYHFLRSDSAPYAQALHYHSVAGDTPCMLDVETTGSSKPDVDQVTAFIKSLKGLGGRVWGVYFPKWYWGDVGGDLGRLTAAGAVLVSSNYTAYSDSGPGWAAYGGATPVIWQYTSSQSYAGQAVDFNAFKGTVAELSAIINGDDVALTADEIRAIARAVYEYGEESIVDGGQTVKNVPLGNLVHGSWVATNHTLIEKLDQVLARLSNLAVGVAPSAQANAAETLALLKERL
jgi:hypothetical protein